MAWGAMGVGGARGSNDFMPDHVPYSPDAPDPYLAAMRNRARDFAWQTTYQAPNDKVATHFLDPFSGGIRQLIEDRRRDELAENMALANHKFNLGMMDERRQQRQ